MRNLKLFLCFFGALCCLLAAPSVRAFAAEPDYGEEVYEKSGADSLYDGLEQETKELLSQAGVENVQVQGGFSWDGLFSALSQLLRDKLLGPLKALAGVAAAAVLCRLAKGLDSGGASDAVTLTGTLFCAAMVVTPLLELMRTAYRAVESASMFLLAAVPVYAALMTASGSPVAGSSYSFLSLAAGSAIPVLCTAVIFPLLHGFLALALASAVSAYKMDRLTGSLYGFCKWLLILAVTVFSGVLSVQTALNAQVDAATNKAAKLVVSTAVPIVGGAFGDAVAAIQNSIHLVKSGAGAFGILAALCIFAPAAMEASIWSFICGAGEIAAELFEAPKLAAFLKLCGMAAKMVLAVLISTCAVCVVSAAIILFVRGSL